MSYLMKWCSCINWENDNVLFFVEAIWNGVVNEDSVVDVGLDVSRVDVDVVLVGATLVKNREIDVEVIYFLEN